MDFNLTEDQRAFQDTARGFAREKLLPHAGRWDEERHFPAAALREAAALGFAGIYVDEAHGGTGLTRLDAALIFEELAYADPSTAAFLTIHNMVAGMVARFGNDEQRARFLPKILTAEHFVSYCLTEPGSGSDAAALATRAEPVGNAQYKVNGTKAFISGGGISDLYVTMLRTGDDSPRGISCVVIEKDTPGLAFGKPERKLGWNSQPTSLVTFADCLVPVANRLGDEGEGFRFAMMGLDGGRINIAACSLGGAQACLDAALAYVKERRAFGRKLADFQALQFKLADMATELDAARLMVHRAAASLDAGALDAIKHCAMAKRYATDVCFRICDEALQLHGGYGYIKDYQIERYLRDLRVHRILEGTNEIMRVIIARKLLEAA
ncbi:acyl-CoA dehydrogenase family protein [Limobrevibacterium gyesilva]|uniref:Acyl-CoA dehydrogenase family protein n=1 Tax=Limobrevibacterium gyesilva TaxID=2991712 RepID=A0AA41YQZ3_9PROT|nr:acyl-CoA dehydrogenase family protein [Limobrevibacterium gyesilva]MCW3477116.1 acyl-CoA dehydrogenase family protein [Limobrevibacterium gyesilva]